MSSVKAVWQESTKMQKIETTHQKAVTKRVTGWRIRTQCNRKKRMNFSADATMKDQMVSSQRPKRLERQCSPKRASPLWFRKTTRQLSRIQEVITRKGWLINRRKPEIASLAASTKFSKNRGSQNVRAARAAKNSKTMRLIVTIRLVGQATTDLFQRVQFSRNMAVR